MDRDQQAPWWRRAFGGFMALAGFVGLAAALTQNLPKSVPVWLSWLESLHNLLRSVAPGWIILGLEIALLFVGLMVLWETRKLKKPPAPAASSLADSESQRPRTAERPQSVQTAPPSAVSVAPPVPTTAGEPETILMVRERSMKLASPDQAENLRDNGWLPYWELLPGQLTKLRELHKGRQPYWDKLNPRKPRDGKPVVIDWHEGFRAGDHLQIRVLNYTPSTIENKDLRIFARGELFDKELGPVELSPRRVYINGDLPCNFPQCVHGSGVRSYRVAEDTNRRCIVTRLSHGKGFRINSHNTDAYKNIERNSPGYCRIVFEISLAGEEDYEDDVWFCYDPSTPPQLYALELPNIPRQDPPRSTDDP